MMVRERTVLCDRLSRHVNDVGSAIFRDADGVKGTLRKHHLTCDGEQHYVCWFIQRCLQNPLLSPDIYMHTSVTDCTLLTYVISNLQQVDILRDILLRIRVKGYTYVMCVISSLHIAAVIMHTFWCTHAKHTYAFNSSFSGTTWVTNLDFTEARDSEWQWHQVGHMQVCTSLQTDNHASTPPLSFLQARCPSCHPTNSVKALKARTQAKSHKKYTCINMWVISLKKHYMSIAVSCTWGYRCTVMFGHSGEKQHTCVVCMLIHTGERPAKCSVYYKQFTTHGSLSTCMYTHTGEQLHECDVCLKRFIERGSLNAHMLLHTSEKACAV